MTLKTLVAATLIASIAYIAFGRGDQMDTVAADSASVSSPTACAPLKIALVADKSKSAPGMRTPTLTLDDLESLIEIIASCGGELAVGVIHDQITDPFVRLRLDARPQKPADSQTRNQLRKSLEQDEIDSAYASTLQRWEEDTVFRIETFGERVTPLINHPADADWSPVWDSVFRGDLFLAEKEVGPAAEARRVLILVSDAVDDVRGRPTQRREPLRTLKSGATVLIVNGAGSAGSLTALEPESFESFGAAVRYVDNLASAHATTTAKAANN